ncbi:hypothetical protein AG0111_0g7231 [Alternaria gaisen]|uniref:Uncharacterized protein n=1 Tax=Alternaria gaisen TaxID=167740 RepID=A0ACB6FI62_9PLEO|nr:hypothetical protein AG0111_0g7231 [Alternaria gaisen]
MSDGHVQEGADYKHTQCAQRYFEDENDEDDDKESEQVSLRMGLRSNHSQDEEEEDNADILMGLVFQSKVKHCEEKVSCCYLVAEGSRCIVRVIDGGNAALLEDIMVLLEKNNPHLNMVIPESQKCKVSAKKKGFRYRPNLGLYSWAARDLLYSYGLPGWRAAFDRLCLFAAGTPDTDFSCHRCSTHISLAAGPDEAISHGRKAHKDGPTRPWCCIRTSKLFYNKEDAIAHMGTYSEQN